MTEKRSIKLTDEILEVFKIYARIGKRSPNESFLVVYDTQLKVIHTSGTIISTYHYDSIGLEEPFALFDSNKLINVTDQFSSMNKEYELIIKKPNLIVKSGKNKFSLYLVDFVEKGRPDENDVDSDNKMSSYMMMDDTTISSKVEEIKTDSKVTFILSKEDISRINKYQKIMNTRDKFVFKKTENGDISVIITDETLNANSDVASFDIEVEDGINKNKLTDKDEVIINLPLSYLVADDYKVTINSLMLLEGVNKNINYIIAPDIEPDNFDDDDYFDDDFGEDS
jgi:hypothetical protein